MHVLPYMIPHLHFLLLWGDSYLRGGDELFPRPHPEDGAIIALAALGEMQGGERAPGQSLTQERTLFQHV